MGMRTTLLAGLSITAVASGGLAQAADYAPIYAGMLESAPELRPVEIGTGWYLRGDVGYEFDRDYDGSVALGTPFASVSTPFTRLGMDDGFNGGLGVGYRFTEYFRGDLTARYGQQDVSGAFDVPAVFCGVGATCTAGFDAKARTWDLMANAYVDLGTIAGFTPYLGGGIGAVNVDYSDINGTVCTTSAFGAGCETSSFDGSDAWRFAYNLQAGVAYNFNHTLALDVGYRYLNVDGDAIASTDFAPGATLSGNDDGYERHTITAGLRYSLW